MKHKLKTAILTQTNQIRLPKRETTRIYNKRHGYYVEDCKCEYCLHYLGRKNGRACCALDGCAYIPELLDAYRAGRIKRKWK